MSSWLSRLRQDLKGLDSAGLRRNLSTCHAHNYHISLTDHDLVNLSSNDYLGISHDPRIITAATNAIAKHGYGSGSSRLVAGGSPEHHQIEKKIAQFKGAQNGLLFPTGYMANIGVLTALATHPDDLVCIDKLSHASLIDAAQACPARMRVYPHLHHDKLHRLLEAHTHQHHNRTRFIVTDSVFSMDGDTADLPTLCDLADQHDAVLIVDEAHGTGVLGQRGAGLCELLGVEDRVDVVISTASKALGCLGGMVTADQIVIDTLINRARSFIYTTAPPAAQAAAIQAALDIVKTEPHRRQQLTTLSACLRQGLSDIGWDTALRNEQPITPIIPLVVGEATAALSLADHLREHGFYAPAIRPPTVPKGTARVRLSLRADIPKEDIERLIDVINKWPRS